MKRYLPLLLLVTAAIACSEPASTNSISSFTLTTEPCAKVTTTCVEITPTPVEIITPVAQPTSVLVPGGELVRNGDFENWPNYQVQEMTQNPDDYAYTHITPDQWQVWYADQNYMESPQLAYYRCNQRNKPSECSEVEGKGNDYNLHFGRPEYKYTDLDNRVHSGNRAAQWFSYSRVSYSGYQQHIYLPTRDFISTCNLSIWFDVWTTDGSTGLTSLPQMWFATHDDKLEVQFLLGLANGPMFRPDTKIFAGKMWAHPDLTYDHYARYDLAVQLPVDVNDFWLVTGVRTAWPWPTQNFYVDDTSVKCTGINFSLLPDN